MRYRHRVLCLLSLLSIITYLDRVCISVAGPRIQDDLHISPAAWGWVGSMFAIGYAAFEIPSGYLGDRIGPRRVLTRIVLWWSVFTSLTGTVTRYVSLLVTRFLFGAGEAGAYPNASAVVARWFPVAERGRALGVVWTFSQLGGAMAPLVVVPLQMRYGWRSSFFVFGAAGVAWALAWWRWFRDDPALRSGVSDQELREIGPRASPSGHGLPWMALVGSLNFWSILGEGFAKVYAHSFFVLWLHTYLVRGRGFTEKELLFSTLVYLFGAAGNVGGGWATDAGARRFGLTRGRRYAGISGLGVGSVCLLIAATATNRYLGLTMLGLAFFGISFEQPSEWATCVDVGGRYAGAVSGCMNTAANLGGVVSSAAFGYLVKATNSYELPLIVMSAVLAIGALLWLRINAEEQVVPGSADSNPRFLRAGRFSC
jgi:MFS family permease